MATILVCRFLLQLRRLATRECWETTSLPVGTTGIIENFSRTIYRLDENIRVEMGRHNPSVTSSVPVVDLAHSIPLNSEFEGGGSVVPTEESQSV